MSTIENGLRADVMRQRMEDKNSLDKGYIYIGTGNSISLDNVTIKETKGMKLSEAIQEYGGMDSCPLSDALNPQLLNTNPVNGEKKTISFYTGDSSVDLGNNCIVPSNSQGIIISNGTNNITLYYSDAVEADAFFYNGSTWDRLTQKIKTNSIEPSSPSAVNLGSKDNCFNTIYAKGIEAYQGFEVNFNHDTTDHISFGYRDSLLPINTYRFLNGQNADSVEQNYAWIASKGLVPYKNNEVNFNVKIGESASIEFGYRGSTARIDSYIFNNGQGGGGRSDIKCKGMEYSSYYNPTGAPLNDPTSQDISENIRSINQRLSDLGFREGAVTANTGVNMSYSSLRRQGNYVIGEIQSVTVDTVAHAVEAFTLPDWAIPKQIDIAMDFIIPITVGNIENHIQLTVIFKRDGHIALGEVPDIPINLNFGYDIMEKL